MPLDNTAEMTPANIRARLDALATAMAAKGLSRPSAEFWIRQEGRAVVHLAWRAKSPAKSYEFLHGTDVEAFDKAEAFVANLPTPEEAHMRAFLTSLDETIQLGKKADVEVEAINPLLEIFKRISKNAITHRPADLGVEVLS